LATPAVLAALATAALAATAGPTATRTSVARDTPVPILEYHVIGAPAPGAPLQGLYVSPGVLRAQVDWLAAHGWHAVSMDEVLRYWEGAGRLPEHPIVLTFDDGYPGDWRYALPILRAHRWPGVLDLQIGNLAPLHVRQLIAAGWEVEVHTFTHPFLTAVGPGQLVREVGGARTWIRNVFHVRADVFCYPHGAYDAAVLAEVRRAGFAAGLTERQGWASPREGLLTLDRLRVTSTTGVNGLAALLGE
jgi:peptidoglycan/xylan/chitin deacetylase (PgdA/CDA1 family)